MTALNNNIAGAGKGASNMGKDLRHAPATKRAKLKQLSIAELMQTFLMLESPTIEEMNGEYSASMLKHPSLYAELIAYLTVKNPLIPWLGKAFRPVDEKKGRGYNFFNLFGKIVRHYPMETIIAPSRYDGKPAYQLVYRAFHSGCGAIHMVDEVRRFDSGLYLAIGTSGFNDEQRQIPSPFMLEGPIADYRGDIGRPRKDYRPETEVPALALV